MTKNEFLEKVNYQDRLVCFGFDLIKTICKENDVDLIVINQTTAEDPNQELVNDVLSVIDDVQVECTVRRLCKIKTLSDGI